MSLLFYVFIQPLITIFDLLFSVIYSMIEIPVLSIVIFSIVINVIVLPLYNKADMLQKEEQEKAKKMKKWVKHIRKSFKGNERFMMLSNYYRIENYKPINALKEAIPLLLQVPFFIAAYKYISSLSFLDGVSYGPITNLLAPDGLFAVGPIKINVLPILMTVVNILAGYLYSKDGTAKQKLQIYITAVVFLVLLYNSPSILVIYWLMNNVFSVYKILYNKYRKPGRRLLPTVISVILIILVVIGIITETIDSGMDRLVAEIIVVFSVLSIMKSFIVVYLKDNPSEKDKVDKVFLKIKKASDIRQNILLKRLLLAEGCFVILLGIYTPSTVLSSSANEFTSKQTGRFYYDLLYHPFVMFAGVLLVWLTVVVFSRDKTRRYFFTGFVWVLFGVSIVNQFFFNPDAGTLYTDLSFEDEIIISNKDIIINAGVCLIVGIGFWCIFRYCPKLMECIALSFIIGLGALSVWNIKIINETLINTSVSESDDKYPIKLSKNGKNVVVMMLDRAIGEYVPYIFDEKKDLKDSYAGFKYYPNTISFGTRTNFGAPGLFGGYEYIPSEIDKRKDELLVDKHNEALKLMPVLFDENGYNVVVCDPPYAGYKIIPDLSIYDDYPTIKAYTLRGKYSDSFRDSLKGDIHNRQLHNFMMYSIYRGVPLFAKNRVYDNGRYIAQAVRVTYFTEEFVDAYSVLDNLPEITEIKDDDSNNFLMFQNDTPHNPVMLNPPDYKADNKEIDYKYNYSDKTYNGKTMHIDSSYEWEHYCVNVATYLEVAEWLDYLKNQGVYDNTRIILVADHGYHHFEQFDYFKNPLGFDVESVQPLLMVKDFNSTEEWMTDMTFMTNADVPTLAMDGIINNPINPFTGKEVTNEMKYTGPLLITDSWNWDIATNNGYVFDYGGGEWWSVRDNIYDMNNWKKEE